MRQIHCRVLVLIIVFVCCASCGRDNQPIGTVYNIQNAAVNIGMDIKDDCAFMVGGRNSTSGKQELLMMDMRTDEFNVIYEGDIVYKPTVYDGQLYFVIFENDNYTVMRYDIENKTFYSLFTTHGSATKSNMFFCVQENSIFLLNGNDELVEYSDGVLNVLLENIYNATIYENVLYVSNYEGSIYCKPLFSDGMKCILKMSDVDNYINVHHPNLNADGKICNLVVDDDRIFFMKYIGGINYILSCDIDGTDLQEITLNSVPILFQIYEGCIYYLNYQGEIYEVMLNGNNEKILSDKEEEVLAFSISNGCICSNVYEGNGKYTYVKTDIINGIRTELYNFIVP